MLLTLLGNCVNSFGLAWKGSEVRSVKTAGRG